MLAPWAFSVLSTCVSLVVLSGAVALAQPILWPTALGRYLFRDAPSADDAVPWWETRLCEALRENLTAWILVYGSLFTVFEVIGRRLPPIRRLKFDPAYVPMQMVAKEARRSAICVVICSAIELYVERARPWAPQPTVEDVTPLHVFAAVLLLESWADFHFFCQHRMMHIGPLYRNIHKVHHQSVNPNVFSGLSFHPLEGAIYFSMLLIPLIAPVPYWAWRLFKLGAILGPSGGHLGHGFDATDWHYIHHKKTYYNFGNTRLFDCILGMDFRTTRHAAAKEHSSRGSDAHPSTTQGMDLRTRQSATAKAHSS